MSLSAVQTPLPEFLSKATTDASGAYSFTNLDAGTYSITEAQPAGFNQRTNTFGTLGGMYMGVITATEAAAVGAFGAFLIAILRGKLLAGKFWAVMAEVTQVTAMIYMLIFGALVFAYFCELTGIAAKAAASWLSMISRVTSSAS